MTILFITTNFPRSYREPIVSGVVKNPFSAAVALTHAGHSITVLTDGPHRGTWQIEGIHAYGVGPTPLKGVVAAFFADIKISMQFLRLRRTFDVIHIHSGNVLGLFLLKKLGFIRCPIVYTAHGTSTPELRANTAGALTPRTILLRANGFVQEMIDRVMWSSSDMLVSASDYQIGEMKTLYGVPEEKIVRIYNGVDTVRYFPDPRRRAATREELGIAPDVRVVLFVGRMAPKKGVHLLVEACSAIADTNPNVVFLCVSGNTGRYRDYRKKINTLIAESALGRYFRIIDDVAEEDLPHYYAAADLCVFPSLGYESLPTVIYEGMACGVPIVTQGSWGTPEVLEEVLMSEKALKGGVLAQTIRELLDDPDKREVLSRSYRQRVKQYAWSEIRSQYEALYERLIRSSVRT